MDRNRIATVNIVFSVNALFFAKTFGEPEKCIIFVPVFTGTTLWSDARVVEEARLESVYTPKAYRGFESPSLRRKPLRQCRGGFFIVEKLTSGISPIDGVIESLCLYRHGLFDYDFVVGIREYSFKYC